jgi:hypothetical protein
MGYHLVFNADVRAVTAAPLAATAAQIHLFGQVVLVDEFFDGFEVPVVAATETGTAHADNDLFFHQSLSFYDGRMPKYRVDINTRPPENTVNPVFLSA